MKKSNLKNLTMVAVSGIGLLLIGCGQAANPNVPVGNVPANSSNPNPTASACPAGQSQLPSGACVSAADFSNQCQWSGGYLVSHNGSQACRMNLHFWWNGYTFAPVSYPIFTQFDFSTKGYLPLLTPTSPNSPLAFAPGIQLRKGDQLSVSASGGWSDESVKKYSWFIFTVYTTKSCNDVSVSGFGKNSSGSSVAITNDGQPAGLMGSDGTEAFLIGASTVKTISNDGMLRLGFNAPPSVSGCSSAKITKLQITRCTDASGNSFTCQ